MPEHQPGPLSDATRSVLNAAFAYEFDGAAALREHVDWLFEAPNCECGCGSLELTPTRDDLPRSSAESPLPLDADILDANGGIVGGLIFWLADGHVVHLEVSHYLDAPLPMPAVTCVRFASGSARQIGRELTGGPSTQE